MNTEITQTTRTTNLKEFTEIIEAIALHASTDKTRLTLCAIKISPELIEATDSYTLGQWIPNNEITTGEPALYDARQLTTALKNLTKAAKDYNDVRADLTVNGQRWLLTARTARHTDPITIGQYSGDTIPTEYPNTKQLFDLAKPAETPFEPTGLNPEYLERLTKASRKIDKTKPLTMALWQTPEKPIIYTTTTEHGQLKQLIMPQRQPK